MLLSRIGLQHHEDNRHICFLSPVAASVLVASSSNEIQVRLPCKIVFIVPQRSCISYWTKNMRRK